MHFCSVVFLFFCTQKLYARRKMRVYVIQSINAVYLQIKLNFNEKLWAAVTEQCTNVLHSIAISDFQIKRSVILKCWRRMLFRLQSIAAFKKLLLLLFILCHCIQGMWTFCWSHWHSKWVASGPRHSTHFRREREIRRIIRRSVYINCSIDVWMCQSWWNWHGMENVGNVQLFMSRC